ncbi:MAG: hypothetical protein KL863_01670 [Rhizobium sp.]|nr:hypothetical protein [Rhizobium sp.]
MNTKQFLTTSDLSMLGRILDQAGLQHEGLRQGDGRRDRAARLLISLVEQGGTGEEQLRHALQSSMSSPDFFEHAVQSAPSEGRHAGHTATVATAGGYRYGRRVEENGSWTIYHVFSGIPAEYASWKMVGLNVRTAERALRILNTPANERPAT